jgi:hypothetical protein
MLGIRRGQSSGVVSKELLYPNIWLGSRIPCFGL